MPKSKRFKKVSLTQTDKKGLKFKQSIVEEIRKCVDDFDNIFLFSVQNMRNAKLKDIRMEWRDSRFFFGKNKVITLGLGKAPEDEYHKNLHKLSKYLLGQCGLLFTNRSKEEVLGFFGNFSEPDYSRSGDKAKEDVILPTGPLPDFSHAIEPHLRSLGMPTSLNKGVVTLIKDYVVCKQGQVLRPAQASILKLLGKQMAEFRIFIKAMWSKDGTFKKFKVKGSSDDVVSIGKKIDATKDKPKKAKAKQKKTAVSQGMDEDMDDNTGNSDAKSKKPSKKAKKKKTVAPQPMDEDMDDNHDMDDDDD